MVATTTVAIATTTTSRAAKEAAATTTAVVKAEEVATGEDTAGVTPTVVTRREVEVDGTSAEAGAGDEEGNG